MWRWARTCAARPECCALRSSSTAPRKRASRRKRRARSPAAGSTRTLSTPPAALRSAVNGRGNRPCARGRSVAAAAGRARSRPALPGKAGAGGALAQLAGRRHDDPPGRARYGLRNGAHRSPGRDGLRRKACRGSACGDPEESRCPRSLSRRGHMSALLEVRDFHVAYGKVEAVHGVSLAVAEGSIVTVIGPNGAGKTTLLGAIMGLLPSRGELSYAGMPVARVGVEQRVALGLCLVPERRELFGAMTVSDNLELGAFQRYRAGDKTVERTRDEVYRRFPRLAERRSQWAGTLSGGERQMLALGRALMAKPRLLMLDEPSLGLAPLIVKEIFNIIAALKATGVSILLVEQNARAALQIADYGYVLETGELAIEGPSAELAFNPRVAATYLGQAVGAN